MGKLKIDFTIKDRDKKLLMLLLVAVIFSCSYFFGYQKLMAASEQYTKEAANLEIKRRDLVEKNNSKVDFEDKTKTFNSTYSVICSNYSSGVSQDASLDFLNKVQLITGSWIKSTTISDTSLIYTFGKISSTNPSTSGAKVYSTDMKGFKTSVTLSYEATYAEWKNLVSFINNYYSKNTIENISMTYNEASGIVSGAMTMSTYAITGSTRKFTPPTLSIPYGTDNIFDSAVFKGTASKSVDDSGEYILSDYDYFVTLNASTADVDACIVGQKGDASRATVVSSDNNTSEDVTIRFAGSEGVYTVQYKIGTVTYPAKNYDKGVSFTPGNTLDLLIMSSSRLGNTDLSGVKLTLINESDKTLNVKACNDDTVSPRIKIASKTGSINIYQ